MKKFDIKYKIGVITVKFHKCRRYISLFLHNIKFIRLGGILFGHVVPFYTFLICDFCFLFVMLWIPVLSMLYHLKHMDFTLLMSFLTVIFLFASFISSIERKYNHNNRLISLNLMPRFPFPFVLHLTLFSAFSFFSTYIESEGKQNVVYFHWIFVLLVCFHFFWFVNDALDFFTCVSLTEFIFIISFSMPFQSNQVIWHSNSNLDAGSISWGSDICHLLFISNITS